jgi:hypothetical protein
VLRTVCVLAAAGALVLLGVDIGQVDLPPGVFDWGLAVFSLALVILAFEWTIHCHASQLAGRVDALAEQVAGLHHAGQEIAALTAAVQEVRDEIGERLDAEMMRGSQAALDELAGRRQVARFPAPQQRRP